MTTIKSLILGSAAVFVAVGGAQAADLPLKAKAVEYVKVCSLYGAGFYYIPGTDTCIKLGGYLRADTSFNSSGAYNAPRWSGQSTRTSNDYVARARETINLDTRTATEYGVVRTYFDARFNWTTGSAVRAGSDDAIGGGNNSGVGIYYAFIQFAGFTFGKAVSQFTAPWTGYPGNNTSSLLGGQDDDTGINQISYTANFGNGVTAAISLEDAGGVNVGNGVTALTPGAYNSYDRSQLYGVSATGALYNGWGGTNIPDIVGQIRVDQAWGLFQASAAAHQIRPGYYDGIVANGHPDDTWGYAAQLALSLKNLPTGPGDTINLTVGYTNGASRYMISGTTGDSFQIWGGGNTRVAYAYSSDGVFGLNGSVEKTEAYGLRGAFNHNWDPYWSSSLFGSYTQVHYNNNAKALLAGTTICSGLLACNPDFTISQLGLRTAWTPVKNLTLSGEVMYTNIDQKNVGFTASGAELASEGTWTFGVRAQRNF
jgi:hypothetical protein